MMDYAVRKGSGTKWTITAKVLGNDPATGGDVVTHDFTGAAALTFPDVLTTLTAAQVQQLVETIAPVIVEMKAGLR